MELKSWMEIYLNFINIYQILYKLYLSMSETDLKKYLLIVKSVLNKCESITNTI